MLVLGYPKNVDRNNIFVVNRTAIFIDISHKIDSARGIKVFNFDTDRNWEKFGKNDPYYGVLTDDKYRKSKLTNESKEDFFTSGYEYIDLVLKKIKENIDSDYSVRKALDFGCGVGRLVIPLSEVAETVTGVDISESMLHEARKNCDDRAISNIDLVKSDDALSSVKGKFDLIHSFIVFQHIPVKRGERIFENLIEKMEDGGVGVVHFTYAKNSKIKNLIYFIKGYLPFAGNIINVIRGRGIREPQMQMNNYDLNKMFLVMQKANVCKFHAEFTNHGDELGIIVYFQKPKKLTTND